MKNIFHNWDSDWLSPRFIFQQHPQQRRGQAAPGAVAEEDENEEQQEAERLAREEQRRRARQEREAQVARADVGEDTRQLMRECLASDNVEYHNLVDSLLHKEIEENDFKKRFESMSKQDRSWKTIFDVQSEVRKKIQKLQLRAESYREISPHKATFDALLKQARQLNRQDDKVDRGMKVLLAGLVPPEGATLNPEYAKEIYMSDPLSGEFDRVLKKYHSAILRAPNGKKKLKELLDFKREEARIERRFAHLYNEQEKIIQRNLNKVRRKAERERFLKRASRSVGITIKEGVIIDFDDSKKEQSAIAAVKSPIKIARISFDEVRIYDHNSRIIDKVDGVPHIHLSDGSVLTLGRFKKWVDATDATERIGSLRDVEVAIGVAPYDIKIKKGMTLAYPRRTVDSNTGKSASVLNYVTITEIADNKIHFDTPVLFYPGFEETAQYEMRSILNFGQFTKWWRRYEVETAINFEQLRKMLLTYNELENKQFGIPAVENPPILLMPSEELRYPDESGLTFNINNVDTEGITFDNGEHFTLPEFFYWVKNNNVQKTPHREKSSKEKEKEIERMREIAEDQDTKKMLEGIKKHKGEERITNIIHDEKRREAGSLIASLKEIWWTTQFLSLKDLWNMTKEIVEFVKRKHERRSKGRYGEVGSRLPWVVGTEFERVKQAAENEEVNKYKEAMEHWSVEKVKRTLYGTGSKDESKACIMTLLHHGEMRWDDPHFWHTLNRLTSRYTLRGAGLYIPEPHLIPPGKSGEDMTQAAMDALWGDGQASQWWQENISKYNGNKKNFEYKFKQLENDPKGTGGPGGECQRLLNRWLEGHYVNPQDYEAMIDGAIKFGKMTAEKKMFYILVGIVARQGNKGGKNPGGETLLHIDRAGELDSVYLNQFPLLDFFTTPHVWDPVLGKRRKPNFSDYEGWVRNFFPDEFDKCKPGPQFNRFMWEKMLTEEYVRTRMSKGVRNAENMDHDDAHLYIPPLTPSEIDNMTTGPAGQKKYFTNEGYMNAYPGFNQYILSLSYAIEEETDEERKKNEIIALRDAINSFVRYDAILDNRFHKKEGDHRARLDDRHYRRHAVVDESCLLGDHQKQIRNVVVSIGKAYGLDLSWLYGKKTGSMLDSNEAKIQQEYEKRLDDLKTVISHLFEQDNGQRALEAIKQARERGEKDEYGLRGIKDSKRPERDELLKLRSRAKEAEIEAMKHKKTGGH